MMNYFDKLIRRLENWSDGLVGVCAYHTLSKESLHYNVEKEFLLCSTYKIPMAIHLLQKIERGELALNQMVFVHHYDLRPGLFSTLNQLQYSTPVQMSILNLLQLMLQESCNTATDIILKLAGGPNEIMKMLRAENINSLHVDRSTLEILADWDGISDSIPNNYHCTLADYKLYVAGISHHEQQLAREKFKKDLRDHGTPNAMNSLLIKLFNYELIKKENTELLLKIMQRCKTGPNRIMGLLPPKTKVSHKTGTLTGYVHDVGVIYLPEDWGEIIISVFVELTQSQEVGERVIAEVVRSIYDYFLIIS